MLGILIVSFFILLFAGVPIAFSMAIAGAGTILAMPDLPNLIIAQKMFTAMDSFSLMAVPFFMMAGSIMAETGITENIVKFADSLVGHIKGGLGHTSILAGIMMAGVSGSANADAAALGAMLVPSLKKSGYEEGFAVSMVACAGALGPIIPPSIMMIIYSGVTGIPAGELFMGGILPGICLGLSYMILNAWYAKKHDLPAHKFPGFANVLKAFKGAIWALLMPFIIIGGVLTGVVTATEAGVIAVLYGIAYGLITRKLNFKKIWKCANEAAFSTAVTMVIIAFASLVGYLMAREDFSAGVMNLITRFHLPAMVVLGLIVLLIFFLGMFIDSNAILLMIVPVVAPVLTALDFDPIHYAMVLILALVLGGITPPVGLVLYIVSTVDNTPLEKSVKAVWPFVGANLVVIVLLMFIPGIATLIPNLLGV